MWQLLIILGFVVDLLSMIVYLFWFILVQSFVQKISYPSFLAALKYFLTLHILKPGSSRPHLLINPEIYSGYWCTSVTKQKDDRFYLLLKIMIPLIIVKSLVEGNLYLLTPSL